jgi:molybdopterin/thiamine biosynthesis adenylyltransferase
VVDHDTVDLTNLQRQIAHNRRAWACPRPSRRASVAAINPDVHLRALVQRADEALLDNWCRRPTWCSTAATTSTRHAVNAACVRHGVPLVSRRGHRLRRQISVYDTRQPDAPCYACLFPPDATFEDVACATMGVFAPLVGIVGSVQAAEALKLLAGTGQPLAGRC